LNEDGRSRSDDREASDNALLMAIAQGDRSAFRRLMARHTRGLLAMAERITGNAADAEEIVQETFLKIWTMAAR
jgi:RNA polymerase sigma-70 factor (ECF subfamily)